MVVFSNLPRVVLVGHPNVGKSQLFNLLTGRRVIVSNYPGTTVELTRGKGKLADKEAEFIDSPGLYSLSALSPEEQVTRLLLLKEKPALVIQVIDIRNLPRMLSLTLELIEAELPILLILNMIDEAEAAGLSIDSNLLSQRLGVPIVCTSLITGRGLKQLIRVACAVLGRGAIGTACGIPASIYPPALKNALFRVSSRIRGRYGLSPVTVAAALFHPDPALIKTMEKFEGDLGPLFAALQSRPLPEEPLLLLAGARRKHSAALLKGIIRVPAREKASLAEGLSRFLLNPAGGTIVLVLVLYFGFYRFVGGFGAGTLVELLEQRIFSGLIAPRLNTLADLFLPWMWLKELLVMDYGILTLGFRYAFAIILPIMAAFFLFFSLIEDSGYLPRAAYLMNHIMEKIGLNGKAVIPLILGLGCGTLAVMVTRTLETRRERLQASLLLSLAVPCSAQMGLILALLAESTGLLIWLGLLVFSFLGTAIVGRQFWIRQAVPFCLEIPPLRMPRIGAILRKTAARLRWYLREVLPLFAGISILMWLLRLSGLIDALTNSVRPLVELVGLPAETALIFVFGFLRRDYGAAGLFDLSRSGVLDPGQVLVAAVMLTLFLPCVAQLTVLVKEHGVGFAGLVAVVTALVAWLAGFIVYLFTSIPFIARLL
jgi:ferrous iron transport protein B